MTNGPETMESDAPATSARKGVRAEDRSYADAPLSRTVTIRRPRDELYGFWRDFTNLPRVMANVTDVVIVDERRSHWTVAAPGERTVEWDAVITEDEPGHAIAWESTDDAQVKNSGRIDFRDAPPGRGTEVTVTLAYQPPAGAVGKLIAKAFQKEPNIQARRDLRRFKQLMETGEISTSAPPAAAPRA